MLPSRELERAKTVFRLPLSSPQDLGEDCSQFAFDLRASYEKNLLNIICTDEDCIQFAVLWMLFLSIEIRAKTVFSLPELYLFRKPCQSMVTVKLTINQCWYHRGDHYITNCSCSTTVLDVADD